MRRPLIFSVAVLIFAISGILAVEPLAETLPPPKKKHLEDINPLEKKNPLEIQVDVDASWGLALDFILGRDAPVRIKSGPRKQGEKGARVRVRVEHRRGGKVDVDVNIPTPQRGPAPVGLPADGNSLAGVLQSISLTEREIILVGLGPNGGREVETTLLVPEEAKVTRDQKTIQLEDLKEGERVVVRTDTVKGKKVVQSIQAGEGAMVGAGNPDRLSQALNLAELILNLINQQRNGK